MAVGLLIGILIAIVGGLFLLFLIVGGYALIVYNSLISLRNNIEKAWSNIGVLLKQRSAEIPKLIASVKGYMKHEKSLLKELTNARTSIMKAKTMGEKAKANNAISDALKSIFAVAENYPKLRASENFVQLQKRISGIENEIADRREFHNAAVTRYNTRIEQFPASTVARWFSFERKNTFRASAKEAKDVEVKF